MGNNIDGKVLAPETARNFKKAVERAQETLSHQNYPSTAAIHGILTEAGLDTEADDLLIKVSTCIRDYLDKMSDKLQKKLPGGVS